MWDPQRDICTEKDFGGNKAHAHGHVRIPNWLSIFVARIFRFQNSCLEHSYRYIVHHGAHFSVTVELDLHQGKQIIILTWICNAKSSFPIDTETTFLGIQYSSFQKRPHSLYVCICYIDLALILNNLDNASYSVIILLGIKPSEKWKGSSILAFCAAVN